VRQRLLVFLKPNPIAHSMRHPTCDLSKENAARRRLLSSILIIAGQAAINADFDFRRYAMKPMPQKPRIIIAHVEGSGTAEVTFVILKLP
jgi:hypothetical protein